MRRIPDWPWTVILMGILLLMQLYSLMVYGVSHDPPTYISFPEEIQAIKPGDVMVQYQQHDTTYITWKKNYPIGGKTLIVVP